MSNVIRGNKLLTLYFKTIYRTPTDHFSFQELPKKAEDTEKM